MTVDLDQADRELAAELRRATEASEGMTARVRSCRLPHRLGLAPLPDELADPQHPSTVALVEELEGLIGTLKCATQDDAHVVTFGDPHE